MHGLVEPQAFDIGPGSAWNTPRWPGISAGRTRVSNATYLALPCGSTRFSTAASGMPTHGITIDQPSTQRMR